MAWISITASLLTCKQWNNPSSPVEQRAGFEKELATRKEQGKTVYPLPDKFLASLSCMPESAGIALGVDRLVMLLTNQKEIDSILSFTPEEL